MCHSGESSEGRTHPEPRKPSKFSASDVPACTHARISVSWDGSMCRVTETVTGADMSPLSVVRARRTELAGTGSATQSPHRWCGIDY